MKVQWLDRVALALPHLTLCTSQSMFDEACKHIKCTPTEYMSPTCGARTHTFTCADKITCIVCMDGKVALKKDPVVVYGMLVHEATHIVQAMMDSIGEKFPASEQQAYAMQNCSQQLFWEWERQKKIWKRQAKK